MVNKKLILNVSSMSCEHCVKSIEKALKSLEGIKNFEINLEKKTVIVIYDLDKITADVIKQAIEDEGYDVNI